MCPSIKGTNLEEYSNFLKWVPEELGQKKQNYRKNLIKVTLKSAFFRILPNCLTVIFFQTAK